MQCEDHGSVCFTPAIKRVACFRQPELKLNCSRLENLTSIGLHSPISKLTAEIQPQGTMRPVNNMSLRGTWCEEDILASTSPICTCPLYVEYFLHLFHLCSIHCSPYLSAVISPPSCKEKRKARDFAFSYLETNPWGRCPGDDNRSLSHFCVERRNRANRLICEVN